MNPSALGRRTKYTISDPLGESLWLQPNLEKRICESFGMSLSEIASNLKPCNSYKRDPRRVFGSAHCRLTLLGSIRIMRKAANLEPSCEPFMDSTIRPNQGRTRYHATLGMVGLDLIFHRCMRIYRPRPITSLARKLQRSSGISGRPRSPGLEVVYSSTTVLRLR